MASANQKKATFISNKLKLLNDHGDDVISAVGHYVKNIIAAGNSWTQEGDNNMGFQELCQKIDTAVEVLCEKCEELSGSSVGAAANQLSCEQQNMASQSIAAASSTSATSYRQAAAPLASTATTSYRQSTESVQPADETQLKPVLAKIAVIEEAMYSLRSRTEKVAEQQSGIDQQLKEVLSKLSESDKKHSSKFKQFKQQISDISETQDAIEQEQKTRLQSLEKQLQKISTAQNRQKGEMESQAELVEKLVHVPNLLESMKENVDALDARIDGIFDDCRNKHDDIKTETRDLADKVMDNTQSAQLISEGQVHNTTLLRELETRLQTLEADGGRNVKDVQKQVEKGDANFQILCQMLNDRLRPLEQLRTCLNERASMRDDNVAKLSKLIQEVAVMSPRLQQLEETPLKPVLDRISVIEEATCSFRSRTEKVAEQQSGIDQQLKDVLSKLSESDKKYSSRFKQVKQQISETQDAIEQEQKTRLQSLEKELQKIYTAQNKQKEEMESQAELVEKLVHVPNLLESVKENVDALDARIDGIIDDCRNKHEDIETVTRDLADKVMANTQRVKVISESQPQKTIFLRGLETRLRTLEAGGGRNVKDVQKQIENVEANFRMLRQMFNDRLRPLEQLRTRLKERASMRDDNVTQLFQVIQEVALMSPRLQQLEVKSSGTRCGFSAETRFTEENNTRMRQYKTTYCNVGRNFNAESGIFTAPVDGLYVASISSWISENELLHVSVEYKRSLDQSSSTLLCCSSAMTKGTTACNVRVVDMKAGDELVSYVYHMGKNNSKKHVCFSCFLLR